MASKPRSAAPADDEAAPAPDSRWALIDADTPKDRGRALFVTSAPAVDNEGLLVEWRQTRTKPPGSRVWTPTAFWASVLTRKRLDFEPFWWRPQA